MYGSARSDHGAIRFVFRRGVYSNYHHHGTRVEAAGTSYVCGAPAALAYCAELCRELLLHCDCLAESPPPAEVLPARDPARDLDELRTPLYGVTGTVLD